MVKNTMKHLKIFESYGENSLIGTKVVLSLTPKCLLWIERAGNTPIFKEDDEFVAVVEGDAVDIAIPNTSEEYSQLRLEINPYDNDSVNVMWKWRDEGKRKTYIHWFKPNRMDHEELVKIVRIFPDGK